MEVSGQHDDPATLSQGVWVGPISGLEEIPLLPLSGIKAGRLVRSLMIDLPRLISPSESLSFVNFRDCTVISVTSVQT